VPKAGREQLANAVENAILPNEQSPMRVINMATRQASYSNSEGRAVVRREGEGYQVVIHGPAEEVLYKGAFSKDSDYKELPRDWRRKVCALRRGLDHALESGSASERAPRARVMPQTAPEP
jgi:hypothetical protein